MIFVPKPPVDTTKSVTGITGTIHFRGTRPSADSLTDLRVVMLYRKYSIDSIFTAYINGEMAFGDSIARFVDSTTYQLPCKSHRYGYVCVAQHWGTVLTANWRAVGVYAPTGDPLNPGAVDVLQDSLVRGVDIIVDYDHLPPQ